MADEQMLSDKEPIADRFDDIERTNHMTLFSTELQELLEGYIKSSNDDERETWVEAVCSDMDFVEELMAYALCAEVDKHG